MVATRIQQSFPWVIPIHCVAHKLELGILDGVKAVKYLSEFEAIVKTIYLFYHYSPKRRRELTEIATVLEEDLLQYGAVKNVDGSVSGMNRIKTAQRNSMSEVVLQDLMSICVDGPSLEDFDATESINMWLMEGTGTRHLDGHQPMRTASVSSVDSAPPSTPAPLETV